MTPFNRSRRDIIVALGALGASGCFGKFGATTSLWEWNRDASSSKWLRWLVFLVLIILPVYGLFILADILVLNTIEFFTDDNPITGGHAKKLPDGHTVESSRTEDPNVIRHEVKKDGELVRVVHVRRVSDHEMILMDEDMKPLSRARIDADGEVELLDAEGRQLSALSSQTLDRVAMALEAGVPPTRAVLEAVEQGQREEMLASARLR